MTKYTTNAELRILVANAQQVGRACERLGEIMLLIAGGVWDRWKPTDCREEFVAECATHLLGSPLRKCWTEKGNQFSYFTTAAVNLCHRLRAKLQREARTLAEYRERMLASYRAELVAHGCRPALALHQAEDD